jgi:transcriptional regulator with XRE-family HTH domain
VNDLSAFVKPNDVIDGANMPDVPSAPLAAIAAALRRERERVGISLAELARRAGLAKSTLSQLEAGAGNPSVETLWALGVALGVPFSRLVEPPVPAVRVIRAGQATGLRSDQATFVGSLLDVGVAKVRSDLYVMEMEPGAPRLADPHNPGSTEHVVVAAGRLRLGPQSEPVELTAGDYIAFPGDVPHVYEALEPGTWAVLVMKHP